MPRTSERIRLPVPQNYLYEALSQVWYVPVDGGVHTVHFQEGTYDRTSLPRAHRSRQDVCLVSTLSTISPMILYLQ